MFVVVRLAIENQYVIYNPGMNEYRDSAGNKSAFRHNLRKPFTSALAAQAEADELNGVHRKPRSKSYPNLF